MAEHQHREVGFCDIGDLVIIRHDGAPYSLLNQAMSVVIIESLLNPFLTIRITISDAVGLIESLPIIGEEHIYIEFKTKSDEFNYVKKFFRLQGIDTRVKAKSRLDIFDIVGISPEYFASRQKTVDNSFQGVTPSDIATNIFHEYMAPDPSRTAVSPAIAKSFKAWKTNDLISIYSPKQEPVDFLNTLANTSHALQQDPETGDMSIWADYIFFENLDGYYFYPQSALRLGYGGLGDSFFLTQSMLPGQHDEYGDDYLELKAKMEKDLAKFQKQIQSGSLKDMADQLGVGLGKVTGQLAGALNASIGPMTQALQEGSKTLSGVMQSIMNGVILDGAGKPRADELKRDMRESASTIMSEFEMSNQGDQFQMNERGLFRNSTEVIDPIRKTVRRTSFNYDDQFGEIGHTGINQHKLNSKNSDYVRLPSSQLTHTLVGYNSLGNYRDAPYIRDTIGFDPAIDPYLYFANKDHLYQPHRTASWAADDNIIVNFNVPGHSMTRAGQIIDCYVPTTVAAEEGQSKWDSVLTNSMGAQILVQTVAHIMDLTKMEYTTAVTGIKDSYANDVDSETETEDLYIDL